MDGLSFLIAKAARRIAASLSPVLQAARWLPHPDAPISCVECSGFILFKIVDASWSGPRAADWREVNRERWRLFEKA